MRCLIFIFAFFIFSICPPLSIAAQPTVEMCAAFARFASKWIRDIRELSRWTRNNCDKIQPRPADVTCDDVERFVAECDFGDDEPAVANKQPANQPSPSPVYANSNVPVILPRYLPYTRQTSYDYGQYGNWYYPNFYPWSYVTGFNGLPQDIWQLESDYKFTRGGAYPFQRADNSVNIALQQTYLPTCLHDIFFCIRASNANRQTATAESEEEDELEFELYDESRETRNKKKRKKRRRRIIKRIK